MRTFEVNWITNKGTERTIRFVSLAEAKGAKRNAVVIIRNAK